MSVFVWVTENEGFFSGLVAIAALLGISGAAARLIWVRSRGIRPSAGTGWRRWAIVVGGIVVIGAVTFVLLNSPQTEVEPREMARAASPSIAVLPFTTMSGVTEHEWLSDGMTEDIITLLARSPAMQVIARNSTFQYKGQSVDIRRVGEELGADFVVEGSVRPIGDRVRVTAQLIDASSGKHVWAEKYDRQLDEIFAVQDEVTTGIAAALGDELFKVESIRATEAKPGNLDAWGQTWRAEANWSVEDARKAVALDADYARAHAVLGRNLAIEALQTTRDQNVYGEAQRAARRAADLAPDDVIVLTHLGQVLLWSGHPRQALKVMARVPAMSPSYAEGIVWYGDMLIHNGRPAEGLEMVDRGIKLAPSSRMMWMHETIRAEALVYLGRFEEAKTALEHGSLDESLAAPVLFLAGIEAMTGNMSEAERLREEALRRSPGITSGTLREMIEMMSIDGGGPNFVRLFESLNELWREGDAKRAQSTDAQL